MEHSLFRGSMCVHNEFGGLETVRSGTSRAICRKDRLEPSHCRLVLGCAVVSILLRFS